MAVSFVIWLEGMVATESPHSVGNREAECENSPQLYEGFKRRMGICAFG
jgi:hypothetical protein